VGRDQTTFGHEELAAWRGLLRAYSTLTHELDSELIAAHELPLRSYEVLAVLGEAPEGRLRMTELSRSVLLSASGITRLVDRLELDGFVVREPASEDRRGYFAVLTRAGGARLDEARPTYVAGVRRLFLRHFERDELAVLARFWERVAPEVPVS
jgi:DNA-binding MarR family transcriptional regulator